MQSRISCATGFSGFMPSSKESRRMSTALGRTRWLIFPRVASSLRLTVRSRSLPFAGASACVFPKDFRHNGLCLAGHTIESGLYGWIGDRHQLKLVERRLPRSLRRFLFHADAFLFMQTPSFNSQGAWMRPFVTSLCGTLALRNSNGSRQRPSLPLGSDDRGLLVRRDR